MQMLYSPIRSNGVGLSDGEVMERLWSFLRRFSRMTKEMRPGHRVECPYKCPYLLWNHQRETWYKLL